MSRPIDARGGVEISVEVEQTRGNEGDFDLPEEETVAAQAAVEEPEKSMATAPPEDVNATPPPAAVPETPRRVVRPARPQLSLRRATAPAVGALAADGQTQVANVAEGEPAVGRPTEDGPTEPADRRQAPDPADETAHQASEPVVEDLAPSSAKGSESGEQPRPSEDSHDTDTEPQPKPETDAAAPERQTAPPIVPEGLNVSAASQPERPDEPQQKFEKPELGPPPPGEDNIYKFFPEQIYLPGLEEPKPVPQINFIVIEGAGAEAGDTVAKATQHADIVMYESSLSHVHGAYIAPEQSDTQNQPTPLELSVPQDDPNHYMVKFEERCGYDLRTAHDNCAPTSELRERTEALIRARAGVSGVREMAYSKRLNEVIEQNPAARIAVLVEGSLTNMPNAFWDAGIVHKISVEPSPELGEDWPTASALDQAVALVRPSVTRASIPEPLLDRVVLEMTFRAHLDYDPYTVGLRPAEKAVSRLSDSEVRQAMQEIEQVKAAPPRVFPQARTYREVKKVVKKYAELEEAG